MEQRLSVDQLDVGMFVIELDRPWLDTPFMLQGFLVEDQETLDQLRSVCEHVVVDWARSVGAWAAAKPKVDVRSPALQATAAPRVVSRGETVHHAAPRLDAQGGAHLPPEVEAAHPAPRAGATSLASSAAAQPRVQSTVSSPTAAVPADSGARRGFLDWLRGMLPHNDRSRTPAPSHPNAASFDPAPAVAPTDLHPLRQELARISDAYERASQLLQATVRDIRLGKGLEIEAVNTVVEDVVESVLRNPSALQLLARLRDADQGAYGHALQSAVLLVSFGRELGFGRAELQQLGQIGMLFDIGKLKVPDSILTKHGTLTPDEFEEAKRHVEYGLEMVGEAGTSDRAVMTAIAQHHERLDGSGYPKQLRGSAIGAFGRMTGIVDCFGAMTRVRPYAEAMSAYDAMRLLQKWGDRYFNSGMVEQFIQAIGIFPVGTLVELSTGEAAVIVEQHPAHRLKPKVLVITDAQRTPLDVPIMLDLLYGVNPGVEALPHIRRGLPAESVGMNSVQFYLAHL